MSLLKEKINHFVVLMLENRSFDHIFGNRKDVDGVFGRDFVNYDPDDRPYRVGQARYRIPFDPGHEFSDVQIQMYGLKPRKPDDPYEPNPPDSPLEMKGFVASSVNEPNVGAHVGQVMECYEPDQVRTLSRLAEEFALFNYWFSSMPGPTWPNRFFMHAATARGYTGSPSKGESLRGFTLGATIFDRLSAAGKDWRFYRGDLLPNFLGITELRDYIWTDQCSVFEDFAKDIADRRLPAYSFIEPAYDFNNHYLKGNSMHPRGDVRDGECLIKKVYDALRQSEHYWPQTLLVVTFDEHGGFYDHIPPPEAVPPDNDMRYANPDLPFAFDRLGPRVPTIAVSAYTARGTVIGRKPGETPAFDHTSILKTIATRFELPTLTARDAAAPSLEAALNFPAGRLGPYDAPLFLKSPNRDTPLLSMIKGVFGLPTRAATPDAPLTNEQQASLGLAFSLDLKMAKTAAERADAHHRYNRVRKQAELTRYIQDVERRMRLHRQSRR